MSTAVNIERSTWYHIVLCWDNESGLTLYKDGTLLHSRDFKLDAKIKSGGILILGQVQKNIASSMMKHFKKIDGLKLMIIGRHTSDYHDQ